MKQASLLDALVAHFESDAELHSKRLPCCQAFEVATKPANTRLEAALVGQMRAFWLLRSIDSRGWRSISPLLAELCSFGFVADRSPSAAGSATRHSQQPYMIKSLAALAVSDVAVRDARLVTAHREP